jgi:serine/threonine-protein kinase
LTSIEERLRALIADRYRVEREIGRGGMATVFLAVDLKHGRPVAIKVLDPGLSALLGAERFRHEIEYAARLQHPHILTLLDSGAGDGLLYYVMPYVEGESLRARLDRERQLGLEEATRLAEEVARALDYAHRQGVVHRDIKPENILLADGQAMIADFGIARAIRAAGGEKLTQSGTTLGTPPYMSPEQLAGGADLDGRSDLYSLGCVLYEMLAGQPPFTGPAHTLGHQHLNVAPRPVSELRPTIPAPLEAALQRALAKTPADRFASASQLADALRSATTLTATAPRPAHEPAAAMPVVPEAPAPPTPAPQAPPAPRGGAKAPATAAGRRAWAWGIAAGIVVVALIGLWRAGLLDRVLPGSRAARAAPRQWVWLAAFEGPAADPSLAATARELVSAVLDQSERVAVVPVEQVRIALANSGRPESTRVDAALARQLAYRSSIPVVVDGRVGRIGGAYNVVLNASDAGDGHAIFTAVGSAADDRALVPTLTRLARDLRRGLGERPAAFRFAQSADDAPTPSFEAFKLYARGRALNNEGDNAGAIAILRRALALDPDFAAAWGALSTAFSNQGQIDSALVAGREALRHPERLTDARRLDIVAKLARYQGDERAAMEAYDAMLKLDPSPTEAAVALNNLAIVLSTLGRHEQALEMYRRSAATWPVGPPPISHLNIASTLVGLERPREALVEAAKLKGPLAVFVGLQIRLLERAWDRADSLGRVLEADPTSQLLYRALGGTTRASILALRGEMAAASRALDRVGSMTVAEGRGGIVSYMWWNRAWFAQLTGRELPIPPAAAVSDSQGASILALYAAMRGDSANARRLFAGWRSEVPPKHRAAFLAQVDGWLDWRGERWTRVLDDLRESALGGLREGIPQDEAFRTPSRWLMADAFERLGQPDSAVVYLDLMLEPPGHHTALLVTRGFSEPFVRRRLVALNVALGRLDEARRQWDALAATTTRPDPELLASLDETRAALQSAEAMRAAARK